MPSSIGYRDSKLASLLLEGCSQKPQTQKYARLGKMTYPSQRSVSLVGFDEVSQPDCLPGDNIPCTSLFNGKRGNLGNRWEDYDSAYASQGDLDLSKFTCSRHRTSNVPSRLRFHSESIAAAVPGTSNRPQGSTVEGSVDLSQLMRRRYSAPSSTLQSGRHKARLFEELDNSVAGLTRRLLPGARTGSGSLPLPANRGWERRTEADIEITSEDEAMANNERDSSLWCGRSFASSACDSSSEEMELPKMLPPRRAPCAPPLPSKLLQRRKNFRTTALRVQIPPRGSTRAFRTMPFADVENAASPDP